MAGNALIEELSEGSPLTDSQFHRLSAGCHWSLLVSSLDRRDRAGLPVLPPEYSDSEMPIHSQLQMTVVGPLVLKLYITLVFTQADLARLALEPARARKPISGRLLRLLRSDFVRNIRNSLAHGTFEPVMVGMRFSDGDNIITATPGFLGHLSMCLSLAQLQAAAASFRRVSLISRAPGPVI
jgi:hypothetical protein